MYEACLVGDSNGASYLISCGADIDDEETVYGHTALHAAISSYSVETVRTLLNAGADPTIKNRAGQDALL